MVILMNGQKMNWNILLKIIQIGIAKKVGLVFGVKM
jgi:hypothetical protein